MVTTEASPPFTHAFQGLSWDRSPTPPALLGGLPAECLATGSSQSTESMQAPEVRGHCIPKAPWPPTLLHTALSSSSPQVGWGRAEGL